MLWFSNNKSNCSRNRHSNTLLYGLMIAYSRIGIYLLEVGLFDLEYAEKHRPTMFHTDTVRPRRSGPRILYNTPLTVLYKTKRLKHM